MTAADSPGSHRGGMKPPLCHYRGRLPFIAVEITLGLGAGFSGLRGRDGRVGLVGKIGGWVVLVPTGMSGNPESRKVGLGCQMARLVVTQPPRLMCRAPREHGPHQPHDDDHPTPRARRSGDFV
jgi:hypothetical protein